MIAAFIIAVIIITIIAQANSQPVKVKNAKKPSRAKSSPIVVHQKSETHTQSASLSSNDEKSQMQKRVALTNHVITLNNDKLESSSQRRDQANTMTLVKTYHDESIIDITTPQNITSNKEMKSYSTGVPRWPHQYVYSHTELEGATAEQKQFYSVFKSSFLNCEYLDLEGNTNYAFILLFDLLNDYNSHKDINRLEQQLKPLGQYYPKTKSYASSFLVEKMVSIGDSNNARRVQEETRNSYQNYDYDYWKLGSKYKAKLQLNENEVKLLNNLGHQSNNFSSIEFCSIEILKLYLSTIKELSNNYKRDGLTTDTVFLGVADLVATKQYRYKNGTQNYKYSIESTTTELYVNIYKHCENAVREHYGHKRKINADSSLTQKDAKIEFETKVLNKVRELIAVLVLKAATPNEATDIELYAQNTSRWRIRFEELTSNYNGKPKEFVERIVSLGQLNSRNPSIENIFYEASKFIASYDKESALLLYIYYLHHDLKSTTFDNKQLTKSIQKNLFKTPDQFETFERIVNEFIAHQDLEKALNLIPGVYEVKRKKINLDTTSIKEVQKQHSGTVELLNEYLKDENDEAEHSTVVWKEKNSEEVLMEITHKTGETTPVTYTSDIAFTPMHTTALDLFAKSNFTVSQNEFETFAKSKGMFKNQLIESINEVCYDFLDDLLIEEEDEYYTINTNYYQRIFAK